MKPKLFVGCSVEGLPIAYVLQEQLEQHAQVVLWNQGVFHLSGNTLDDLIRQLDVADVGVFILSPDDVVKIRGAKYATARDNVILELGLFLGRLGRPRTFFVTPRDTGRFRIPTDLMGVTPASYDATQLNENVRACIGPACNKIREAVQRSVSYNNQGNKATLVRGELHRQILNCFRLYKATLGALRGELGRVRIHFLKYVSSTNELQMLIQDDVYQDRRFVVSVTEGLRKGVVVCEALKTKRLVAHDLPEEHSSYYPDSEIPYSLRSVVAYPVRYRRADLAGVVALDSELTLEQFGIDRDQLSATFLKLCDLVEQLIRDHEPHICEV